MRHVLDTLAVQLLSKPIYKFQHAKEYLDCSQVH
jgi:hypothetical protein